MSKRPIGIFDSGLGGLTAAEELRKLMPGEHIIYLGDSANMPYGQKTHEQIVKMSRDNMGFLLKHDVKLVFVACGSATSNALDILSRECPVPIFGVVDAAVEEAIAATKNGRVGLLATCASVKAGSFERGLLGREPQLFIYSKACPRFATMVEDGIFDKDDPRVQSAVKEYLPEMKEAAVDTAILGCTHYPMLADVIGGYMGEDVSLISSGAAAARAVAKYLREKGMENKDAGISRYYTSGDAGAFAKTAFLMLKEDISAKLTQISPFDKS